MLDKKQIKKNLNNKNIEIDIFDSLGSTNDYLHSFLKSSDMRICLAEQQTHGKGRLNHHWHSPFGVNIYLSCLYAFHKNMSELAGLSLVVSLAVIKTLQSYLPKMLHVKWPNDIYYDGKKLAGILIESQAENNGGCIVIIGVGINVNMYTDENKSITQDWTSLRCITNHCIDRNFIVASFTNTLIDYLEKFNQHGLLFFMDEWRSVDYLFNKNITVKNSQSKSSGVAKGINDQGFLLLETNANEIKAFSTGDTSVVK